MRIMGLLGPRVNKFSIPSHHLKLLLLLRTYENDAPLGRDITTIKWLHKQVLWAICTLMFGKGLFFLYYMRSIITNTFCQVSSISIHPHIKPTYLGLVIALNKFTLVPGQIYFQQNGISEHGPYIVL